MKHTRIGERSNSQLQWEYLTKNGQILLGFWCNFQKQQESDGLVRPGSVSCRHPYSLLIN